MKSLLVKEDTVKRVRSETATTKIFHLDLFTDWMKTSSLNIRVYFKPILVLRYPYNVVWVTKADRSFTNISKLFKSEIFLNFFPRHHSLCIYKLYREIFVLNFLKPLLFFHDFFFCQIWKL